MSGDTPSPGIEYGKCLYVLIFIKIIYANYQSSAARNVPMNAPVGRIVEAMVP